MEVSYKSKKLERICTDFSEASRKHGKRMAKLIHQRIYELVAADSVDMLVKFKIGRCHSLDGKRDGQFAMDLEHPHRLIFESTDLGSIHVVEIVDYH